MDYSNALIENYWINPSHEYLALLLFGPLAECIFTIYPGGSVSNGKIALLDNNCVGDVVEALIEEEALI